MALESSSPVSGDRLSALRARSQGHDIRVRGAIGSRDDDLGIGHPCGGEYRKCQRSAVPITSVISDFHSISSNRRPLYFAGSMGPLNGVEWVLGAF